MPASHPPTQPGDQPPMTPWQRFAGGILLGAVGTAGLVGAAVVLGIAVRVFRWAAGW